jgi:hypothetical protein
MNKWKNNPQNLMTAVGCLVGIMLAAGVMVLVWLNQDHSEVSQSITNFLSSLPLLIAYKLSVPKEAAVTVFFVYWGAVGASFGWLSNQRRLLRYEVAALLAVVLAAGHWSAAATLATGIDGAIRAVVEGLKQEGR